MPYFVYMILTTRKGKKISYVGYTNDLEKRLNKHNNSRGAKFTRGNKWEFIYTKKCKNKKQAMRDEYKLKKDYKLRNILKINYLKK